MFYQGNNLKNSKALSFFIFSMFLSPKLKAFFVSCSVARLFTAPFILASKLNILTVLNSGVKFKVVVSGILFLISVAYEFRAALVAMFSIYFYLAIFIYLSLFILRVFYIIFGILSSSSVTSVLI